MKLPWHNKTGIPKAIAILATILMVSIGLCGANLFTVLRFGFLDDSRWASVLLSIAGWVEIAAIIGSILALGFLKGYEHSQKSKAERNQKGTD
ncbi:MAG TPA: hypothetical protein VGM11_10105 [Acidobacteriaceae bacterium]|jgi:hypothetical protein